MKKQAVCLLVTLSLWVHAQDAPAFTEPWLLRNQQDEGVVSLICGDVLDFAELLRGVDIATIIATHESDALLYCRAVALEGRRPLLTPAMIRYRQTGDERAMRLEQIYPVNAESRVGWLPAGESSELLLALEGVVRGQDFRFVFGESLELQLPPIPEPETELADTQDDAEDMQDTEGDAAPDANDGNGNADSDADDRR